MKNGSTRVAAVVVTFNRLDWLTKNLDSLRSQTRVPDAIYVVDNASTDGTSGFLRELEAEDPLVVNCRLDRNTGGAGGFHHGMETAFKSRYDWIWVMDDDCIPDSRCLEELLEKSSIDGIYTPLVKSFEDKTTAVWHAKFLSDPSPTPEVPTAAFNGAFMSREVIERIGLPEKDFFIYGDDVEYSLRFKKHGGRVLLNKDAVMYHPYKTEPKPRSFLAVHSYELSKLRAYYGTRNNVVIRRRYGFDNGKSLVGDLREVFKLLVGRRFRLLKLKLQGLIDGYLGRVYVREL